MGDNLFEDFFVIGPDMKELVEFAKNNKNKDNVSANVNSKIMYIHSKIDIDKW